MARQMNTGTVFRTGRTRHVSDREMANRKVCGKHCILPLLAVVAIVGCPWLMFQSEDYFKRQQLAFDEVEDKVVPGEPASLVHDHDLVHTSGTFTATVGDPAFGIALDHAIKIKRHTEYCQWQQYTRTKCEKCTRTDSKGKRETYDCNCVETYYYTKGWRSYRVNSFVFDQPANHHNPGRDPYPSATMVSQSVSLGEYNVLPEVSKAIRGVERPVAWTWNRSPIPRTFFQGIFDSMFGAPVPTRWEDVKSGLAHTMGSTAAHNHQFVYTNTAEGWFFSPYQAPAWATILRGFGQFLEGSLFDWQVGDIYDLYAGCTAGDIRVRFGVVDPRTISVMGEARKPQGRAMEIGTYHVPLANFDLQIMHSGEHTADVMFDNETKEAYGDAWYKRFLSILAGLGATFLMQKYADVPPKQGFFVAWAGLSLCFLFGVWAAVYGLTDFSGADTSLGTVVAGVVGVVLFAASTTMGSGQRFKSI